MSEAKSLNAKTPNEARLTSQDYLRRSREGVRKFRAHLNEKSERKKQVRKAEVRPRTSALSELEECRVRDAELHRGFRQGRQLLLADTYIAATKLMADEGEWLRFINDPFFDRSSGRRPTLKDHANPAPFVAAYVVNARTNSERQRASKYGRALLTLFRRATPVEKAAETVIAEGIQNLASQAAKRHQPTPVKTTGTDRATPEKAQAAVRVELEANPDLWHRFTEARGHKDYLFRIEVGTSGKLRLTDFRAIESN